MKQLALVTYSGCPLLSDDDRLLVPALRKLAIEASPVVWGGTHTDWGKFDQVILRSCWDYHLRSVEFLEWIAALESRNVPLQNSAPLVRWNADKRYLRQLEKQGIVIPQTHWVEEGEEANLREVLIQRRWDSAVVKPTISATAYQTRCVFQASAHEVVRGPAMVQRFMPEVQTFGEWSLIFIGSKFSHAVRKLPAPGDFRVQTQFGGTAQAASPNMRLVASAAAVLELIAEPTLYARVDGLEHDGVFMLMELELIEPVLFLRLGNAARRLAEEIAAALSTPSRPCRTHLGSVKSVPF